MLARLLILLSMLLMAFGMTAPAAATPHHVSMASMPREHCPEQAPVHGGKAGFVECTMACSAALPATDLRRDAPLVIACVPIQPSLADPLHGLHPETATPPPRRS